MSENIRIQCGIAFLLAAVGLLMVVWFKHEQGRIQINSQSASVIFLRGGYRSYGVGYSDGDQWDPKTGGFTKHLWRRPFFYHNDLRRNGMRHE